MNVVHQTLDWSSCVPHLIPLHLVSISCSTDSSPRTHIHVVGTLRFKSNVNQPSLPTLFYSVLVSISVLMTLSTVFHSTNSPDNSPLSHSVLPVLFLPYWSFQLYYLFMKVSLSPDIILCGRLGLMHQLTV